MKTGYEHFPKSQLESMLKRYEGQTYDSNKCGYGSNGMSSDYHGRVISGIRAELASRQARDAAQQKPAEQGKFDFDAESTTFKNI